MENKKELVAIYENLYQSVLTNLSAVNPIYDIASEFHKFLYGILQRQLFFASDICCLLKYGVHGAYSSHFILSRAILDDFIQLLFIMEAEDPENEVTKLNAGAHDKNQKKVIELSRINEELFDGEFPFYPTNDVVEDMILKTKQNPSKAKYFKDMETNKFHRAISKREMIDKFADSKYKADMARIYFLWRHYSDYVHFSKFTMDFESGESGIQTDNHFKEVAYICYKGMKIIFNFFETIFDISFNESEYFESIEVQTLSEIREI